MGDGSTADNTTDASPNIFIVQTSPNHYLVEATHVFSEESPVGGYTVTTTIHHHSDLGPDVDTVVTQTATVSDPSVSATGGFHLTVLEGSSTGTHTVATFIDPAGAELDPGPVPAAGEYAATIDWGEHGSTSTGTITYDGTKFVVQGSHVYAGEGTYVISVLLSHGTSSNVTVTSTATVADQQITQPVVMVPTGLKEGLATGALTAPATFDDPAGVGSEDPSVDFTATINWGDNTSSVGTVCLDRSWQYLSGQCRQPHVCRRR